MALLNRPIIFCKIPKTDGQTSLSYVSELVYVQTEIPAFRKKKLTSALSAKLDELAVYQEKYGQGVVPLRVHSSQKYMESLYNELLNNHIPLPPVVTEMELPYVCRNYQKLKDDIGVYEQKIGIQAGKLPFFTRMLPWLGTLVTFTITIGITISAGSTMLGWGWSLCVFGLFVISKFFTTYADTSGGPERRLHALGSWLDRFFSGYYRQYGKFCLPRIVLNLLVISLLVCSCLLTWYGAWQMIRCMNGMSYFPSIVASVLAGLFAWSSAGSSFGRIYYDLYRLLFQQFSRFFSMDNVKLREKLDIELVASRLQRQSTTATKETKSDQIPIDNDLLFQFGATKPVPSVPIPSPAPTVSPRPCNV